jgi:hypothetical protein
MAAWARIDVVVLDDLGLQPLMPAAAADLLEVIEDRHGRRSTIVTSQLPVGYWHEALGEPTIADAILDRLVHNAYRIELRGDSLRRRDPPPISPALLRQARTAAHDRAHRPTNWRLRHRRQPVSPGCQTTRSTTRGGDRQGMTRALGPAAPRPPTEGDRKLRTD